MLRILLLASFLSIVSIAFACTGGGGVASTPTEAYIQLYNAVKSKDTEAIKKMLTKKSLEFGEMAAAKNNTPLEKMYENGFTATTFSETLPTIRDERIKDNMGSVEVWNSKDSRWEDLPFINEEGWKLAVGDLFGGSFVSPGRGRDMIEKEAANAMAPTNLPAAGDNSNVPIPMANAPINAPARKP